MNGQIVGGLFAGLLFGMGLAFAGMTDPSVVLGFLDLAGAWNPALAFVMGGAVVVTFVGYRMILGRARPLCDATFHLPTARAIDLPLVAGSGLFGIGWGLSGYCPGPAIASAGGAHLGTAVYLAAMIAGMVIVRSWRARAGAIPSPAPTR